MKQFSLGIWKRPFSQQTNDFSVAGARWTTDGSGDVKFNASTFQDYMNGAAINNRNWKTYTITYGGGHSVINPVAGVGLDMYTSGDGMTGSIATLTAKGATGRINMQSFITFKLNIKGYDNGGTGLITVNGDATEDKIWIGMWKNDENCCFIRNRTGEVSAEYYELVTRVGGGETISSGFTITAESNPDQLIELRMSLDQVEAYLDGVLKVINTTNIPNNTELRPYVKLVQGATDGDNRIFIDYIKTEQ